DKAWPHFHWRYWWGFGGGVLADFGCHYMDLPFWGLGLTAPTTLSATGEKTYEGDNSVPDRVQGEYQFPAGGGPAPGPHQRGRGGRVQEGGVAGGGRREPRGEGDVPRVGVGGPLRRGEGAARRGLRQVQGAPGGVRQGVRPPAAVDPEVDRAPQGVDRGGQGARPNDVPLRLLGAACRGGALGERGVPLRQGTDLGHGVRESDEQPGGRAVPPPRLPQGVGTPVVTRHDGNDQCPAMPQQ